MLLRDHHPVENFEVNESTRIAGSILKAMPFRTLGSNTMHIDIEDVLAILHLAKRQAVVTGRVKGRSAIRDDVPRDADVIGSEDHFPVVN